MDFHIVNKRKCYLHIWISQEITVILQNKSCIYSHNENNMRRPKTNMQ